MCVNMKSKIKLYCYYTSYLECLDLFYIYILVWLHDVIGFGLTGSVLEHTIYRTRGEPGNHYTTDAIQSKGL
jgi:hypothetical protein